MYFDANIGTDIRFLTSSYASSLDKFLWISVAVISQTIRSIIRIMYYVHGNSHEYNYKVMRCMFVHRTEKDSNVDGVIRLRPLRDESDNNLYLLFSKKVCFSEMDVTRHLWTINNAIWDLYTHDEEREENEYVIKYLVCLYASLYKGICHPCDLVGSGHDCYGPTCIHSL